MKIYQVFYILKYNCQEHLRHMFVAAHNQKEAIKVCREQVQQKYNKHCFRATTKEPYIMYDRYGNSFLTV